ncbi:MAG TPA: WecB/TagA/CpsF family glycosyltransferase [Spirochaetota bacterium]|nr:WecB/TagA/CpsF family glycosyltransferase [Spirochaetota bacterium]HPC40544.1 WecB/TagA/CpsF family glycosyltransferase [Spirochaetota bacterium]HPL17529.1 WecB/TagA/CpsF family glycosyltransferase [Spirochaetota bacterium]HQF07948.1 WecB/TagA/CpsF family glycosyltransferase [Spirochaetota bacterium]HQH96508.1 WecB/TagA/CpsF family glycosyltransferase [Spirochaetota bacterium]
MKDNSVYYDSYKEERDLILEYNQVDLSDARITNIMGVGVDNITRAQAVVRIMEMIKAGGVYHVISLNPYKIQRFKSNADLRLISGAADMHLPAGAGIQWAGKVLKTPIRERIPTLSFMMDIVRIAEIKEFSIFLVGGKPEVAERAFFNIKKSFPKIRIVGRHGGYFNPEREKSVIEAIRKSEANIVFVGLGFPKEDRWIHTIKGEFKNTIFISVGGSIDIISGEIKKAPAYFMERGLDWFYRIISKPWRIGRFVRTMMFFCGVILKRLFSRK